MKVRINDDATGSGFKNQTGSWVERFRGKEFEVIEKKNNESFSFMSDVKWITVKCRRGITEKQATLVDELIKIKFGDLPVGITFKTNSNPNDVAIKLTGSTFCYLTGNENNKFVIMATSTIMEVYPVSFELKIEQYKPNYIVYKIDAFKTLYIYKNGDVKYYLNDEYIASKEIDEVKSIIKWTKKSKAGNYLSDNSVLKIDCQDFTIKDIKDFAVVYEGYVDI